MSSTSKISKSDVWNTFIKTKTGGKCKLCHSDIKTCGNTTNLRQHLKRKHPNYESTDVKPKLIKNKEADEEIDIINWESGTYSNDDSDMELGPPTSSTASPFSGKQARTQPAQPLINDSFSEMTSIMSGGAKSIKISQALLYMIIKDGLPLNSSEKDGLKHLMQTVVPLYKLPGRTAITNMINDKYDTLQNLVKCRFASVPWVTLTTDVWTETLNTIGYLGVTCHFLFDHKLQSVVLGVSELTERHDAQYLGQELLKVCEEWGIKEDKIIAVVTDNGKNIVKAVSDNFGKRRHLPCFAHTLNLIAESAFGSSENLKNLIENVKRIVTFFKQSVVAADQLRQAQPENNKLKLIQCVPTRWNSCYYMIERFLLLCEYVAPILLKNTNAPNMIRSSDKSILEETVELLRPIEFASKEICGETYITSSKIIPITNCLRKQLNNTNSKSHEALALKQILESEILKRFGSVEQVTLLAITTLLDPRFKKIHFSNIVSCSQAMKFINEQYKEAARTKNVQDNSTEPELTEINKNASGTENLWSFHEELAKAKNSEIPNLDGEICFELKNYLHFAVSPLKSDPIEYWNGQNESILKDIALKYLPVVGTSVPSERLFSVAGNIITPNRNRLSPAKLKKILFLKSLDNCYWNM